MTLASLAQVSAALAATRSRTEKVAAARGMLARARARRARDRRRVALGRVAAGQAWVSGPRSFTTCAASSPRPSRRSRSRTRERRLATLRTITGKGSAQRRRQALAELFELRQRRPSRASSRGLLLGELRQGALEGVMADAIAAAAALPPAEVRRAIMLAGEIPAVAAAALERRRRGSRAFPVAALRAREPDAREPHRRTSRARSRRFESAIFEYKLDGARVQIHKADAGVRIYSRTGRDVTDSLPEIEAAIAALPAREPDPRRRGARAYALGPAAAFQDTMRRFGRKLWSADLRADAAAVAVLLRLPARGWRGPHRPTAPTRASQRAARARAVGAHRAAARDGDRVAAERFLQRALDAGHEGLMAKSLTSPTKRAAAAPRGSRSRSRTRSISSCSRPNGAAADAVVGSATCTSARAIRTAASSCSARPSRG